ncbi:Hint domain-containing protein [Methylobacterium sp. WSM2598]|uniref:Hint domain-containing protein n=1 Tax=Methylobacterium sp. WSM2598 TaxID=398261 RepID=UPI00037EF39F|nr:Hint domain-containing protein [Methylobacterium sp. WSM2598]
MVIRSIFKSGNYTISDIADSPSDDTTQLGDVADEKFQVVAPDGTIFKPSETYYGRTLNNPGIVARLPSKRGGFTYYLFTNNAYQQGATVSKGDISQTPTALCFAAGTRILTSRGEVAVEDLRVGDAAVTASGRARPIVWIGHRELAGPLSPDQHPVRVRAGAFGAGLPARDLLLSPGHPVLVGAGADGEGGVLVPVMCLINGTSIAREPAARVTYWHVELDAHDLLLAEGLAAESYLDLGSRPWFEEGSASALHDPDLVPAGVPGRCRPVATRGPAVEAERRRLDAVFAASLSAQCAWPETGAVALPG